jgi:ADP-ribosylglycohydrolase
MTDTVSSVVFSDRFLSDPSGTAFAFWDEHGRVIAANGSLMRTTPVGVICLDQTEDETFEMAINMGAVTHADPRCAISVAAVSVLIRGLCRGEIQNVTDVDAVLERAWAYMKRTRQSYPLLRDEFDKHVHASSLESLVLCNQGMGYVYKCLGSALWCLREVLSGRETFKSAIVKLVMCGGDADTNSAVAGALIGAWCGYDALPPEWREGMKHRDWYLKKISSLFVVAGFAEGSYDPEKDPDIELL